MTQNHGFLVKSDRFSLSDTTLYLLRGWLVPDTHLTVLLDGKRIAHTLTMLADYTDERYGGAEALVTVLLTDLTSHKKLEVRADGPASGGVRTVFAISASDLTQKQRSIRYFIDDFSVLRSEGLVRIQGWATAKEPVRVDVYGKDGKRLIPEVERYRRYDTVELFDEYEIDSNCGFNAEIRPIPDGVIALRMRTSDDELCLTFPTDPVRCAAKRAGTLAGKARDALLYGGVNTLVTKTWNKLFNPAMHQVQYGKWIKKHLPTDRALAEQRKATFPNMPLVSIIIPCYKSPENYLRAMVDSVRAQTYANWELILSDGSGEDSPIRGLLEDLQASDPRISVVQNNCQLRIAQNTNAGLAAAKGDWIVFSDHDDLLVPSALYECIKMLNTHEDAELIYTDEDKIGTGDKLMQPNFKPDFDPDFLRSVNYICHLCAVKRELLERVGRQIAVAGSPSTAVADRSSTPVADSPSTPVADRSSTSATVGPLDPAFDGAQDYDFILRCTEQTDAIYHIPKILYHWRFFEGSTAANPESKSYAFEAGRRAIEAHYRRLGLPATVENGEYPGIYRTHWHWEEKPLVSVLIPNKDHLDDLKLCISSLLATTTWPNLEILIIENNSTEPATFEGYKELEASDPRIRTVYFKGAFNYSKINNFGEREAKGDYLLLLNNDTEAVSDFITELMGYAMRKDVGAVGARLYYADNTIQHAGAIVGWGGVAGHAFVNQPRGVTGYQHRIICQQNMSAVTAACVMIRRDVFREAGGFTEELAVAFNDIDLCMKIRALGYLIVYNPFAELYHYESKSRGLENTPEKQSRFAGEIKYFKDHWPDILRNGDPYYNPNLSMVTQDFSLKRN